ncbi:hypothetical protein I2750_12210 [Bacillus sp. PR5]|nr:hypothetical protein [Bacillus sp. PR5]
MKFILIVTCFVMTFTSNASAADEAPFARRNFTLSMTLEEFRNEPHPDSEEWPSAYPVCSTDQISDNILALIELKPTDGEPWHDAGLIKCYHVWRHGSGALGIGQAGLMLGDIGSATEYYFMKNDQGIDILFQIVSGAPSAEFDKVLALFQQKYGPPKSALEDVVSNKIGGTFSRGIVTFANSTSEIVLTEYDGTLAKMRIEYTYKPLEDKYIKKLKELIAQQSEKL